MRAGHNMWSSFFDWIMTKIFKTFWIQEQSMYVKLSLVSPPPHTKRWGNVHSERNKPSINSQAAWESLLIARQVLHRQLKEPCFPNFVWLSDEHQNHVAPHFHHPLLSVPADFFLFQCLPQFATPLFLLLKMPATRGRHHIHLPTPSSFPPLDTHAIQLYPEQLQWHGRLSIHPHILILLHKLLLWRCDLGRRLRKLVLESRYLSFTLNEILFYQYMITVH